MNRDTLLALAEKCAANSSALRQWVDSVFEQRRGWGPPPGVETNAIDAFQMANRVQVSVCALADHIAEAMRAIAEKEAGK